MRYISFVPLINTLNGRASKSRTRAVERTYI